MRRRCLRGSVVIVPGVAAGKPVEEAPQDGYSDPHGAEEKQSNDDTGDGFKDFHALRAVMQILSA